MYELGILEVLAGIFLFLPQIRPYVKGMWGLDGLVWLPVLALGIIAALFPAYGFRPECLPLLLYAAAALIKNGRSIIGTLTRTRVEDFRERSALGAGFSMVILAGATGFALWFLPLPDTALLTGGVRTISLRDPSRGEELFVRIYGPEEEAGAGELRPLMLLIPPVTGSAGIVDRFCGALRERGLTVMTYSRRGFDDPALDGEGRKFGLPVGRRFRLFRAISRGTIMERANAAGRSLEEGRQQDVEFLLAQLRNRREDLRSALEGTTTDHIFLAGYGAGGAALLLLGGTPDFTARYPAVRGIIAVESPVLSVLRGEERPAAAIPQDAGWFLSLWGGLRGWAAEFRPKRINAMTAPPDPRVPALFLVSGWALNPRLRDNRYGTVFRIFEEATGPAVLAAVPGSRPQDYSDVPLKYPLFSARLPGGGTPPQSDYFIRRVSALMSNFAALVLEKMTPAESVRGSPGNRTAIPPKILFDDTIHIETGGTWNYTKKEYIL
jgi:hypothetical protein